MIAIRNKDASRGKYKLVIRVENRATMSFEGLVIESEDERYPVGHRSDGWNSTVFTFHTEKVIIPLTL